MSLESGEKNNEVKEDQEVERQREIQQQEEAKKNAETKRRGSELDDKQNLDSPEKNEVDEDSEKDKVDIEKETEDPKKDKEDTEKKKESEKETEDPEKKEEPEKETEDPEKDKEDPEKDNEDPEKDKEDPEKETEDPEDKEDSEKETEDLEEKEDSEKETEDPEKETGDPEKHNMSELPENAEIVDASKIDMTDARGMDDEHFWEHHGNTKEDYMRIAEHIPDVQKELDSGKTLDEIREDPELRDTVAAYYDADKMVKVEEKPDGSYEFQDDGRHRVAAAQELGYEIPVDVVNKGEVQQEGGDADGAEVSENTETMVEKGSSKSMENIEDKYSDLQERFDDTMYNDSDRKSKVQEIEKLHEENTEAIQDVSDKKQEVDQRKDEIMEKIRDMHMKDEDVTPENNPELKELSEEYHKCEEDSCRLDYLQTKLEDNNLQLEEKKENIEGKSLDQIMEGKESVKSMESIERRYEKLQERFDGALYYTPDKKSQVQEMEKLYGENAQAVHDVYARKQEVDQRKDKIMEEIRDMHMKDEDVTPENNPKLKALNAEYLACEKESHRLGYLQGKIEDNNLQIAEVTGRDYVAASDEFMANGGGPEAEAAYYEKYLSSSLEKLDSNETSAVDAYAFAQLKARLGDSIDRLETAYAPNKPDGPAVPKEKIEELRSKMEELGSRYAEEYKDCKFQPDGTYDRTETKSTEEKEIFSSEIKTDHGEKSFSVRKGSRESRLDENRVIFSDRLNTMSHRETSDGMKVESASSKIDDQGNLSKKEFSASVLNSNIERNYDSTKSKASGKVETNLAKAESSRVERTETGVKETHKSVTIGHTEAGGELKVDGGKLKTKAQYESSAAEAKFDHVSMKKNEEGKLEKDSEIKGDASIGKTVVKLEADTGEMKAKAEVSSTAAEAGGSYSKNVMGEELKVEVRGSLGEKKAEAAMDLKNLDAHAKAESSTVAGSVKAELGSHKIIDRSGKINEQKAEVKSEALSKASEIKQSAEDTKKKLSKLHDLLKKKTE